MSHRFDAIVSFIFVPSAAMHYACYRGHIAMVRVFLNGKYFTADQVSSKLGTRPLHSACAGNHLAVAKYNASTQSLASVNAHSAFFHRLLLENGATVGPTPNGLTPLHSAVSRYAVFISPAFGD